MWRKLHSIAWFFWSLKHILSKWFNVKVMQLVESAEKPRLSVSSALVCSFWSALVLNGLHFLSQKCRDASQAANSKIYALKDLTKTFAQIVGVFFCILWRISSFLHYRTHLSKRTDRNQAPQLYRELFFGTLYIWSFEGLLEGKILNRCRIFCIFNAWSQTTLSCS